MRADIVYTKKYHHYNKNRLRRFEMDKHICFWCNEPIEQEPYYEFGCKRLPNLKYDSTRLNRHPDCCPLIGEGRVNTRVFGNKKRKKTKYYEGTELSCREYSETGVCDSFTREVRYRPNIHLTVAHHMDGNPSNNNIENLRTCHKKKCHHEAELERKRNMIGEINMFETKAMEELKARIYKLENRVESIETEIKNKKPELVQSEVSDLPIDYQKLRGGEITNNAVSLLQRMSPSYRSIPFYENTFLKMKDVLVKLNGVDLDDASVRGVVDDVLEQHKLPRYQSYAYLKLLLVDGFIDKSGLHSYHINK